MMSTVEFEHQSVSVPLIPAGVFTCLREESADGTDVHTGARNTSNNRTSVGTDTSNKKSLLIMDPFPTPLQKQ